MNLPVGQGTVGQRIRVPSDLRQVAFREIALVDDGHPALGQIAEVGLQRSRVHGHQHVGPVAGGDDVVVGEVHLKGGDSGKGALRGADLRWIVGQGGDVVAERSRFGSETIPRQLHSIAGIPSKADHHPI